MRDEWCALRERKASELLNNLVIGMRTCLAQVKDPKILISLLEAGVRRRKTRTHTYSANEKTTMMKNKKGNAFAWISAIGTLFLVAIVYVIMTKPFEHIYSITSAANFTGYETTRQLLQTTWQWWPVIILFSVILFLFVQTLRRDTYGGYN